MSTSSKIEEVVAKTCEGISVIDGLFNGKSKELKIVADFCSVYGDQSKATEVVLKARKIDERTTEIIIEVAGLVAETVTYEAEMIPVKALSTAVTAAILAEGGAVHLAGWFMAVVTGGSVYASGHVVATALSKEAGTHAKTAMKNLINEYNKESNIKANSIETTTPNTEEEFFQPDTLTGTNSPLLSEIYFANNVKAILKGDNLTIENSNLSKTAEAERLKSIANSSFKTVTINNVTFNITQTNNLTVRNALDDIPAVSILLTHINIQVGEKLDLGDKGIYTVQGGDTLSEIAQANGYVTKDLLKRNTWLIDQGRVTFDQNKVLIKTDANDLANQNHTLTGEDDVANILIDINGGDDILQGGNQADILEGGEGFDTYHASDGDKITDSDGRGEIYFDGVLMDGKNKGYSFVTSNNTMTITKEASGESIMIENYGGKTSILRQGIKLYNDTFGDGRYSLNISQQEVLKLGGDRYSIILDDKTLQTGSLNHEYAFHEMLQSSAVKLVKKDGTRLSVSTNALAGKKDIVTRQDSGHL